MFDLNELRRLQQTYWSFNAAEHKTLSERFHGGLSWAETLRLHHLHCLKLLSTGVGKRALMDGDIESQLPLDDDYRLYTTLLLHLASADSPYRPRRCVVWQTRNESDQPTRNPDLQGVIHNASLTHLGCLEAIRINANNKPIDLAFVPLDDVAMVGFAQPALFRAAKIFYDNGRGEEIVLVPLLYGVSWLTDKAHDQDGSFTRFCCHVKVDALDRPVGIGVGHQDFTVKMDDGKSSLFGLGSIAQITVAVEVGEPRFDQKCRARGIDPDTLRRQFPKQ